MTGIASGPSRVFLALIAIVAAVAIVKLLSNRAAYTLDSYKKQGEAETISLRHEGHIIRAECSSYCEELAAMVGQHLFCFSEIAPSDPGHPYGTKRPIFNTVGGSFVCRTDGGTGPLFMMRRFKCSQNATLSDYDKQLRNEYPEDALNLPPAELDKLYCKADETLMDQGGDIVTEDGKVLPLAAGHGHTELLKIIEVE